METTVKRFDELTLRELEEIYRLRAEVFVVEQNCPYQDIDGLDGDAVHLFFRDEKGIAAYLRVLPRGSRHPEVSLGRVVTAARVRGTGLGIRLLREGIRAAEEHLGADTLVLEAQCYAKGFYEKAGFRAVSEEFLEDGIPHVLMKREK